MSASLYSRYYTHSAHVHNKYALQVLRSEVLLQIGLFSRKPPPSLLIVDHPYFTIWVPTTVYSVRSHNFRKRIVIKRRSAISFLPGRDSVLYDVCIPDEIRFINCEVGI